MVDPVRILYMEDDYTLAQLVQERLHEDGYIVELAPNGHIGLAMFDERPYDVVLVDHNMPICGGLEVIRQLTLKADSPPIVMVTGFSNEKIAVEAMKLGASDYVVKDVGGGFLELLPPIIEAQLRQRRLALEKAQAVQALRESEQRYRTVFETTGTATVIIEPGNIISLANTGFVRLSGLARENIENVRSWSDFFYGDWESEQRVWRGLTQAGNPATREFQFIDQVGCVKDVYAVVSAIPNTQRYVVSLLDITQRKQTEKTLARRNHDLALLNMVGREISAKLDLDQVLLIALDEVLRLLGGYSSSVWMIDPQSEDLVCQHATGPDIDVVRGWRLPSGRGIAGWVARHAQSLVVQDTRNDDRHFDAVQQQADVELRSMICVPLRSQQGMMGVLQVVDTQVGRFSATDLVLLEPLAASVAIAIENARLYAQAQQEIAERTRVEEALRERTVELQERNEELDAFAHTVAHDMKGMLTRLIGFAETLSDDCTVMSGDAIHDYANVIVQSGRQINNIVNELLLLARVRKTEVQIEVIDMAHAVDQALQRLDILIEERQARVIVPPADTWPNVLGYDLWVQEIWVNYLSNAIKYGGAVPCVELGFSECGVGDAAQIQCVFDEAAPSGHPSLPSDVSMVCFWVRDNGAGLTAQQQLQLFVPFVRLDHARAIGNGLGLSIVQRIVDKLGGGLGVKSEVGKGSTFSFTLPKAAD